MYHADVLAVPLDSEVWNTLKEESAWKCANGNKHASLVPKERPKMAIDFSANVARQQAQV